tara:strand:+ start:405 stop:662 length:258 start_codon:yes stop_codon:yes gene_type:complete
MEVLKERRDEFGTDFNENKKTLNSNYDITSKLLRNEVAGYITKFIKKEIKIKMEKTKLSENQEEVLNQHESIELTTESAPKESET